MPYKHGTRERQHEISDWTLTAVIKKAEELMKEFPDDLKSFDDFTIGKQPEPYEDWDNPSLDYFTALTDVEKEADRKSWERTQSWEREQYERLKKKFEGQA